MIQTVAGDVARRFDDFAAQADFAVALSFRRGASAADAERDQLLEEGLAANRKINKDDGVQRYKGLGEMNAAELWDTTMDPDHRVLRKVALEDAQKADELFTILMGDDVASRCSFITRNAKDVRFLDV